MENAEKAKATIENGLSTYIESDDVLPNARKRPTQSSKKSHQSFVSPFLKRKMINFWSEGRWTKNGSHLT